MNIRLRMIGNPITYLKKILKGFGIGFHVVSKTRTRITLDLLPIRGRFQADNKNYVCLHGLRLFVAQLHQCSTVEIWCVNTRKFVPFEHILPGYQDGIWQERAFANDLTFCSCAKREKYAFTTDFA
jgi:hypothetical protein